MLALPALCLAGCGYAPGYTSPPGVRTVAVPTFNNATFPLRREVEYDLTSTLRKEINTRTNLRLVDSGVADMTIHGTVREFREKLVAEDRQDRKTESSIIVEVDLVVEDYVNAKQWKERVSVREPLSTQTGETLETARSRALGNLAEKIIEQVEFWEAGS
jgi:hypothetical protein